MKLLLDGVEVPWPKAVEIVVDPAGEKTNGLNVTVRGGRLWLGITDEDSIRVMSYDGGCLDLRGWYTIPQPFSPMIADDVASVRIETLIGHGNPPT